MDFDRYTDSYEEALDRSISFAGADADRYVGAKARMLVELAERRIGPSSGLRALDVGCGPGSTDAFLEGEFGELCGVDVSAGMVDRARKRNPWASYSSYAQGEPLPHEDGSFDLSFAICVFHHVPPAQREALAAEMARVTRPGGVVAIYEHNPWNPLTRKAVNDCPYDEDALLLPRPEARGLLDDARLARLESAFIIFFPKEGPLLGRIEGRLGRLPLGAQYYVAHRRTEST